MEITFTEEANILERLTKKSMAWYTRDSMVAIPTVSSGMIVEQHRRGKE